MQGKIDTRRSLCIKLGGKRRLVYSAGQGDGGIAGRSSMGSEERQQRSGHTTGERRHYVLSG